MDGDGRNRKRGWRRPEAACNRPPQRLEVVTRSVDLILGLMRSYRSVFHEGVCTGSVLCFWKLLLAAVEYSHIRRRRREVPILILVMQLVKGLIPK